MSDLASILSKIMCPNITKDEYLGREKQLVIFPQNSFLAYVAMWPRIFLSQNWCELDPTLDGFFFHKLSQSLSKSKETFGVLVWSWLWNHLYEFGFVGFQKSRASFGVLTLMRLMDCWPGLHPCFQLHILHLVHRLPSVLLKE